MKEYIEVLDTTLRDGEQMRNVSYTPHEKLSLAKILLCELNVDRVEITSARVSEGERKSAKGIIEWAIKKDSTNKNLLDRIEILGFVDYKKSVDWITSIGGRVLNLLSKGSMNHLEYQLRKTKEQHVEDIKKTVEYASSKGVFVNIYFEDWSNGMKYSPDYVYYLLDSLKDTAIKRYMLPDTLGILYPTETNKFFKELVVSYPNMHFEFHGHNDYGLATANTLSSIEGGVAGVHLTINGMGERAGNSAMEEVIVGMNDFLKVNNGINERIISKISKEVEIFSGLRLHVNKPILGENVFTQTAGLHADGDKKGDLYANPLSINSDRFGYRSRSYALGKLSGKASLDNNLAKLDITLNDEQKNRVLKKIIELGDKKTTITEDDLPYIVSDVLKTPMTSLFRIKSCVVVTSTNLKPMATVLVSYKNNEIQKMSSGDGGYDAFMKAIRKIGSDINLELPKLQDYLVIIPPGGRTDALVHTSITWDNGIRTIGVDSDQLLSAIEATEKMVNIIINKLEK